MNKADEGILNTQKIYSYIYQNPCSKRTLYDDLGLSMPTITKNLKQLEDQGFVTKDGFFESEGGRKASIIKCIPDARVAIGLELLKKSFHFAIVDLYGTCVEESTQNVSYENSDAYFVTVSQEIEKMIEKLRIKPEQILGIGISVQGIVSPDGQEVIYGRLLNNTGLKLEQIQKHFSYPCILIHDAKASAMAEKWNQDIENATYIGLNMNIGSAILINGEILTGRDIGSGSIEHICMVPGGKQCYCGKKGCLEMYCSGEQLEETSGMKIETFFQYLHNGDRNCFLIWKDYLEKLALVINNVRYVIEAPVILGGLLPSYFVEEDYEQIEDYIQQIIQGEKVRIIRGMAGKYSASIGADRKSVV